jgi:sugar phosphate isomerase/epimerase
MIGSPGHGAPVSSGHLFGVSSHLFRGAPAEVAAACRRHGLTCVQLTPNFPGLPFYQPGEVTPERCRLAAEPFREEGVAVACLWGSLNLLDPDLDRRHRAVLRLHALLRHCRDFGTDRLVTETGSPASAGPHGRETWTELHLILAEALRVAAEAGVRLLLKPVPTHLLASVEDARRLRDELGHPNLGFVLDPVNFLLGGTPGELGPALVYLVEQLGPSAPVVHAKDLAYDEDGATAPRAGLGVLDYGLFFRLLRRHQPAAPVILEHLRPQEIPDALAHVRRAAGGLAPGC